MKVPAVLNGPALWRAGMGLAAMLSLVLVTDLVGPRGSAKQLDQLLAARAELAGGAAAPTGEGQRDKQPKPADESPAGKLAQRIRARNPFSEPKEFKARLVGILGDRAYFEGDAQGYRAGEAFRGAKIKRLGGDWAELEFNDKPIRLEVYAPGPSEPPAGGPGEPSKRRRGPRGPAEEAKAETEGRPGSPGAVGAEETQRAMAAREQAARAGPASSAPASGPDQ